MKINNILTSGYDFDDTDYKIKLKYILFNSLLIFNICIITIAAIFRLINSQYTQTIFDFIYIIPSITIFILARIYRDSFDKYVNYVLFLSYVVVSLSFYLGTNPLSGISWYLVLLMSSFFLKGSKTGIIVFIASFVTIIIISVSKDNYTLSEIVLGMIPFAVSLFFMQFFEKQNQDFEKELKEKNDELNQQVKYKSYEILRLTQILDKSPMSIIITDIEGRVEYVNPFFSELTGYSDEEVFGKKLSILKSNLHPDEYYSELWTTITNGGIWNGIFKNIKKSGEEYWENAIIAPVNDLNNELTHFIAIKQEITKQIYLEAEIAKKDRELVENFEKTLESFVKMLEERDTYTAGHSQRVAKYSHLIAQEMGLSKDECNLLYRAGILHDIGKIATPDSVLLKPDKLSELEYKLIQEHVNASYKILAEIPMYKELADIIVGHHERYDGGGYPNGLKGDEISLLSHIMIVADAFDAMTTNRIYRGSRNIPKALENLEELSSKQFHPEVVKCAIKALADTQLHGKIDQLPKSDLEKERFSYFYRDQVTDVYNSDYLKFLLNQNSFTSEYRYINVLCMHHFSIYNNKYGWAKGDELLCKIADYLAESFPNTFIFRIYGDDFVLISKEYLYIDMTYFKEMDILKRYNISVTKKDLDLKECGSIDIESLRN